MDCKKVETLLSDLVDGTLDDRSRREVEEHLAKCKDCRHERENLIKTLATLKAIDRIDVPSDFVQTLRKRIDEFESAKKALMLTTLLAFVRHHRKAIVSGAAAFVVAFGVTAYFVTHIGHVEQVAEQATTPQQASRTYIMNDILPTGGDSANTVYITGDREPDPFRELPTYVFDEVKPVGLIPDDF